MGAENEARATAPSTRLQIDTRAQCEVRRLSGGNQQKVTIARWIAAGVRTLLCFDPTRGIDIRTKRQIYHLLRELADAGAAVLLYTSELEEVQLACDRAVVIFGGRVVAEMPARSADEPTLLRAAYALPPGAPIPRGGAAEARRCAAVGHRHAGRAPTRRGGPRRARRVVAQARASQRLDHRALGAAGACCSSSRGSSSRLRARRLQSSRSRRCPLRSRRRARPMAIISGGVDLSLAAHDGAHQRLGRRR